MLHVINDLVCNVVPCRYINKTHYTKNLKIGPRGIWIYGWLSYLVIELIFHIFNFKALETAELDPVEMLRKPDFIQNPHKYFSQRPSGDDGSNKLPLLAESKFVH